LLFALLAQPDLVDAPARRIALAAGIGKSTALEQLEHPHWQDMFDCCPGASLLHGPELLDRWLNAYAQVVRSSWLIARCRPEVTDPHALEAVIERAFGDGAWAYGGAAAAHRMLGLDRGTDTVLHLAKIPDDLLDQLQAVRAPDGPLSILRTPGTAAYNGTQPHLAHPLLVYSELLISAEPRAAQAANALREQYFADWP
jgi:hypothetical protein